MLQAKVIAGEWVEDGEVTPNINSNRLAVSRWPGAKRQAVEATYARRTGAIIWHLLAIDAGQSAVASRTVNFSPVGPGPCQEGHRL